MTKQEIALQLTLVLLEKYNLSLKDVKSDEEEIERNKFKAELTSTIFNTLIDQLNC